jgi:hypothetical protein
MADYTFHVHVQNDMSSSLSGLNIGSVWAELEAGQVDVVNLEPGESVEFHCNDPDNRHVRKRFNAAVTAAGGTVGEVWWASVGSLPAEE